MSLHARNEIDCAAADHPLQLKAVADRQTLPGNGVVVDGGIQTVSLDTCTQPCSEAGYSSAVPLRVDLVSWTRRVRCGADEFGDMTFPGEGFGRARAELDLEVVGPPPERM